MNNIKFILDPEMRTVFDKKFVARSVVNGEMVVVISTNIIEESDKDVESLILYISTRSGSPKIYARKQAEFYKNFKIISDEELKQLSIDMEI